MQLGKITDPVYVAKRLGVLDAVPNAMARMNGALEMMRVTMSGEAAPVAPTPCDLVCQEGSARLLRYRPRTTRKFKEPVLLVPSLINRFYILDIKDGLSAVQALLDAGHAVYIVDWGEPTDDETDLDLGDYAVGRLRELLRATVADAGADKAHVFGQCLGGTMATILAAVDPSLFASLGNLTAPISFHDEGMLSAWSRAPFFDAHAFAEAFGNVPSWITQPSFQILKPFGQPTKILRLWQNLGNPQFLDFFRCLETWINDTVAIPKGFYVDLIDKLYRQNALVEGRLNYEGRDVVIEEIELPLLTICATEDHIVPPESARVIHDRAQSEDKRLEVIAGGHIGVVVGGRGRKILWSTLTEFFGERSTRLDGANVREGAAA